MKASSISRLMSSFIGLYIVVKLVVGMLFQGLISYNLSMQPFLEGLKFELTDFF